MHRDDLTIEDTEIRLLALDKAPEAVVIIDADQRVTYFNAAAEALWTRDRAAVLGRPVSCLGIDQLRRPESPGLIGGGSIHCEIGIMNGQGNFTPAALSMFRAEIAGVPYTIARAREIALDVELPESIAMLRSITDRTNRAVFVTDAEQNIIYTNPAFTRMFGYTPRQAKGHRPTELLAGRYTNRRSLAGLRRALRDTGGGEQEILSYDKNGEEIWISADIKALRSGSGKSDYMFALLTDISETKQLRSLQQLTLALLADELPITEIADRLCRLVEAIAPDVVSSLLHIDGAGLIRPLGGPSLPADYSQALDGIAIGPMVGSCGSAAYYGRPMLAMDIDNDATWQPYKELALAVGLRACWSSPIKSKDGRVIGTFAFYFRECRAPSRWHRQIIDACVDLGALAIERKESRAQIERLAYQDMLTGLPNRARLRDLISAATGSCGPGDHVALAFLDVDNFKDVNDTLGHSAGDEFLVEFAQRLRAQLGPNDRLGRLGGDEFVIVMPGRDAAEAGELAARISAALTQPLGIGTRQVPMSASIGISLYPEHAAEIDTLIRQADTAMYQAKRAGRATWRFFSAEMNGLAEERMAYSAALRLAVANEGLELRYQPQIRTVDGAIHGVEALARWCDPLLGEISPAKFIPLAEDCGLIEQIAMWSIRAACRQMVLWRNQGVDVPYVSVNMSPTNFQKPDLSTIVADILAEYRLAPEVLMLEVTESVVQNERPQAIETMNALRALGVGLSLDDFGTGYSSLSRLTQLPIRELKIDRGFMRDIESDANARAIVTTVVRVGQSLQLTVVAEGVETEGQLALLTDLGCDVVQGFLYAPALHPYELENWLLDYTARRANAMARRLDCTAQSPSSHPATHIAPPRRDDERMLQH
ncbi:EAL domain-containing protein [Rhodopseudomonas sp. HC1]|uniref:EAL domain-containing protein n=1 Tax=Rhodopseudomonas infernalis TaxID=2897386 RepID=UPI001EE80005|nr:EAL domain-containing protein [Rhodopseudomonas infernalis]MCG6206107.1 EAL domain-containing protein [Rhodopseudomonas infernalis]